LVGQMVMRKVVPSVPWMVETRAVKMVSLLVVM
jgi:hypothetical protein